MKVKLNKKTKKLKVTPLPPVRVHPLDKKRGINPYFWGKPKPRGRCCECGKNRIIYMTGEQPTDVWCWDCGEPAFLEWIKKAIEAR